MRDDVILSPPPIKTKASPPPLPPPPPPPRWRVPPQAGSVHGYSSLASFNRLEAPLREIGNIPVSFPCPRRTQCSSENHVTFELRPHTCIPDCTPKHCVLALFCRCWRSWLARGAGYVSPGRVGGGCTCVWAAARAGLAAVAHVDSLPPLPLAPPPHMHRALRSGRVDAAHTMAAAMTLDEAAK